MVLDACKHIEFHFTQIDSDDPDRVFGLALKLRPDKSFSGQLLGMLTDIGILKYPLNNLSVWLLSAHSFHALFRVVFQFLYASFKKSAH